MSRGVATPFTPLHEMAYAKTINETERVCNITRKLTLLFHICKQAERIFSWTAKAPIVPFKPLGAILNCAHVDLKYQKKRESAAMRCVWLVVSHRKYLILRLAQVKNQSRTALL